MSKIVKSILEYATGVTPEIKARFGDESVCQRCGVCCHAAIKIKEDMVLLRDLPCKYLSYKENGEAVCGVYQVREMTGWCHKISVESIRKELFPPSCPYIQGIAGYKGKVELKGEKFEEVKPILVKIFKGFPQPDYVRKSDWDRFIHVTLDIPYDWPPGKKMS